MTGDRQVAAEQGVSAADVAGIGQGVDGEAAGGCGSGWEALKMVDSAAGQSRVNGSSDGGHQRRRRKAEGGRGGAGRRLPAIKAPGQERIGRISRGFGRRVEDESSGSEFVFWAVLADFC